MLDHRIFVTVTCWCLLLFSGLTHDVIAQDDRVGNWTADVDFLAEELPRRHKNLFFELSRDDFQNGIAAIKQMIKDCDDRQLQLELCRLVASVGDGHTQVNIDNSSFEFMPIQFRQFRDGIFITAATDDYKQLLGANLIQLGDSGGGSNVDQIYEAVATVIAHDNKSYLGHVVPYYLNMSTITDFAGVTNAANPLVVIAEKDGQRMTVELPRLTRQEMDNRKWESAKREYAHYEQKENENYWTQWLPESKTLYLKYRRCRGFLHFGALATETMQFINENEVDRFVVDMRLNGGGNSAIMQPLVLAVIGSKINDPKNLYVVIGRRTFSSAVLNTIDFKQKTKATIVGLPTGGKPNHYGEVKTMKLPNCGLVISYSTNYFSHYHDGDPDSIEPDVVIDQTFDDWSGGRDAVMEFILRQPVTDTNIEDGN